MMQVICVKVCFDLKSRKLSLQSVISRHHLAAAFLRVAFSDEEIIELYFIIFNLQNSKNQFNLFDSQSYYTVDTIDFFKEWQEGMPYSQFRIVVMALCIKD
jgi:hypothetical protein